MALTWRQQEVLENLAPDQWLRPMDVGGRDGSHHSATLAALVRKGLAERKHRGASTAWLYRITDEGERARQEARRQPDDGASHGPIVMRLDSFLDAFATRGEHTPNQQVVPGHPVKAGAGYDCTCGECLALRADTTNQQVKEQP